MKITTSRFGEVDILDEGVLTFPSGLIGFPQYTRFALLGDERASGYRWLQSIEEGELAFVVVDPALLKQDYQVNVQDDALAELGYQEGDALAILTIVTIPPGRPEKATANLRGPLVVNLRNCLGKQVILNESFPLRYAFNQEPAPAKQADLQSASEAVNT